MRCKIITMDKNLQEKLPYCDGEIPVVRMQNSLDEYVNGEMSCHWHSEFQFGFLLKGELEYSFFQNPISKISRTLKPGDGFFINSKVLHGCRQLTDGTEIFTFGMLPGFFVSPSFGKMYLKSILPIMESQICGLFYSSEDTEEAKMLELFRAFHKLCPDHPDYELESLRLICQIWKILSDWFHTQPDMIPEQRGALSQTCRIRQMLGFIQQHYREPITVDQIAQAGGVSRRECFRCFRSIIDQTPTEYLNQYRLSVAAHLLTSGNLSLASISESCGFENISYFTKLFKRRFHMLPSQFRNRTPE